MFILTRLPTTVFSVFQSRSLSIKHCKKPSCQMLVLIPAASHVKVFSTFCTLRIPNSFIRQDDLVLIFFFVFALLIDYCFNIRVIIKNREAFSHFFNFDYFTCYLTTDRFKGNEEEKNFEFLPSLLLSSQFNLIHLLPYSKKLPHTIT
jgi:hypothetical protein